LRKIKDPNPKYAKQHRQLHDLYDFTAYLEGETEHAINYRSKLTTELAYLLDKNSRTLVIRNDTFGKICASLATAGKTYVFNSDTNREAYDSFLIYKSSELTALFETMRRLTITDLHDFRVANTCIKEISKYFEDYETALAIYNKEAGLRDEPFMSVL
jgi:hypothetical protein